MNNWTPTRIGSICKTNQRTYSAAEKWPFVNYLDTGNITESRVSEIQHIVVGQNALPSRARRKVAVDDIIYSTVRPNQRHYGIVRNVLPNMLVSTGFAVITVDKEKADSDFLYYYLTQNDIVDSLHAIGEQSVSAYPSIKPSDIERVEVLLPSLPEQVEIGRTLRALDDKIAINREINHHLELMAQAIFKSWFVDFEPWGGEMPVGWREGTLGDIANVTMGQSPDGKSYNEDGIGTVFYQGRAEFGSRFPTRRLFTTKPNRMAVKGDILMSVRAPVGDLNVAFESCCLGRGLAAVQSRSGAQSFILYTMFALKQTLDMFNGEGTVFGAINKTDMANLPVLIPTDEIIRQFEELVHPM
ncbi:MAG: restriction endonuclease subunit S, partial [Treponema sp.]|nr:restriction endonuclease subunit S [Treponema sp.]